MKKSILLIAFVFVCLTSFGQVRVGLGLLGGAPSGDFGDLADFGIGGYIEPKYSLTDNLEVGVHLAWMVFAGADLDVGGTSASVSATKIIPILAVAQYYFPVPGVKPYVGIGIGPYNVDFGNFSASGTGGATGDSGSETKIGFAPKVGINLGGFDIGVAYHIVSDLNFIGFNLGFHIGGRG